MATVANDGTVLYERWADLKKTAEFDLDADGMRITGHSYRNPSNNAIIYHVAGVDYETPLNNGAVTPERIALSARWHNGAHTAAESCTSHCRYPHGHAAWRTWHRRHRLEPSGLPALRLWALETAYHWAANGSPEMTERLATANRDVRMTGLTYWHNTPEPSNAEISRADAVADAIAYQLDHERPA